MNIFPTGKHETLLRDRFMNCFKWGKKRRFLIKKQTDYEQ